MTREEALKVLKKELQIIDDPNVTMTAREWEEHDDHMRDALEMAIAALEHDKKEIINTKSVFNLSDDVISRQAAVDAIEVKNVNKGIISALQSIIEELPSAQPFTSEQIQTMQELEAAQIEKAYELGKADRPKWIPCSERLPKIGEHHISEPCLVYCKGGVYAFAELEENIFGQVGWNCERDDDYHEPIGEVVAWMPLPEAYREDGEEE